MSYNANRITAIRGHSAEDVLVDALSQIGVYVRKTWEMLSQRNVQQDKKIRFDKRIGDIVCLDQHNNIVAIECCSSFKHQTTFSIGASKERYFTGQWYCFIGANLVLVFVDALSVRERLSKLPSRQSARVDSESYKVLDLALLDAKDKLDLHQFADAANLKRVKLEDPSVD